MIDKKILWDYLMWIKKNPIMEYDIKILEDSDNYFGVSYLNKIDGGYEVIYFKIAINYSFLNDPTYNIMSGIYCNGEKTYEPIDEINILDKLKPALRDIKLNTVLNG